MPFMGHRYQCMEKVDRKRQQEAGRRFSFFLPPATFFLFIP
jgi:hypothetical protein